MQHAANRFPPGPGDHVDVYVPYAGTWSSSFELVTVNDGHCEVRRLSDHSILPEPLPLEQVRPARPQRASTA
jgi:hypothetical protein